MEEQLTLLMENTTFTIAVIGCITGCASFLISFYSLLRERFRLRIKFAKSENWYFHRLKGYETYITDLQAVVRINFINKSTHPISIYDVDAYIGKKYLKFERYPHDKMELLTLYETEEPKRKIYHSLPMNRQHVFPLRLEPHETYEAYIFIPYFPNTDDEEVKVKFIFRTTKRTIRKFCKLKALYPRKAETPDEIPW